MYQSEQIEADKVEQSSQATFLPPLPEPCHDPGDQTRLSGWRLRIRVFHPKFLRPKVETVAKTPLRTQLPVSARVQGTD
jgi:hypothetical protein